jgi:capsular polysaccharide biosynthesis protein
MPPTGLAAILKRRWYLVLVGIIVTLALGAAAFVAFPAQYQAKAVVLLLPPASASVSGTESAAGQNPYVSLGLVDGLNDVLAQAMTDSATGDGLLSDGLTGSYTVEDDPATSGPLILVTGTAKTSSMAVAITNRIVALIKPMLLRLQQAAGVTDTKNNVTSTVLNPAGKTVKVRKNQERGVIAAGVAGIVLTLLITAAVDKVILGRRRRTDEPGEGEAEAAHVDTEVAPIEDGESVTAVALADNGLETSEPEELDRPIETLTSNHIAEPVSRPAEPEPQPVVSAVISIEDEPVASEAALTAEDELEPATDDTVEAETNADNEAAEFAEFAESNDVEAGEASEAEAAQPEDEARTSTESQAEGVETETVKTETVEAELVTASQRRPEPTWRLRPGRNPGRERTISRNGRPQPRFDSNQATKFSDEISRPV